MTGGQANRYPGNYKAQNPETHFDCLALLDSLAYYQDDKTRSYVLPELKPGLTVLGTGCRPGDDAFGMAGRIMRL